MDIFILAEEIRCLHVSLNKCIKDYHDEKFPGKDWHAQSKRFKSAHKKLTDKLEIALSKERIRHKEDSRAYVIYGFLKDLNLVLRPGSTCLFDGFSPNSSFDESGKLRIWDYNEKQGFKELDSASDGFRFYLYHDELGCDLSYCEGDMTFGAYFSEFAYLVAKRQAYIFYEHQAIGN